MMKRGAGLMGRGGRVWVGECMRIPRQGFNQISCDRRL